MTGTEAPESSAAAPSEPPAPAEPEEIQAPMAYPTEMNGQITDAVTQSHVLTVGGAPGVAMAQLFQSTAHALSLAAQNAVVAQQTAATLAQAVLASLVLDLASERPAPPAPGDK